MELDWLEDFGALAAAQNFSRAAEMRHVTQPAFSRRIQMLEQWVGTPLFQRQPRRTTLTPAGEHFRSHAEGLVRDLRQARRAALAAAGEATKSLAFAATHALSFSFFPQWARSTLDAESLGSLSLLSDSMAACEEMMLRGDAQFLISHRHPADPGRLQGHRFLHHPIGQDRLLPYAAPSRSGRPHWNLDAAGPTVRVPFLRYAPQSGLARILEADWSARDLAPPLDTVLTARLAAALLTFAADGRGIAWLPESLATESVGAGRLMLASSERRWATTVSIVLYRPAKRLTEAAEALWSKVAGRAVPALETIR